MKDFLLFVWYLACRWQPMVRKNCLGGSAATG
ncbi:Uncharacterised protein [Mycobacterium tuberculosis]|nr:Uncharacterised protein [Mycobacterium tuberculosis]